jgi:hypothetical protein
MRTVFTIVAIVLGVIVLGAGIASVVLGHSNASTVANQLKSQQVSLRVFNTDAPATAVVSNAAEARQAADKINEDLKSIAPSYAALLGGKHFDPTDPKQLSYAQGINLTNSLNLAALAFGLTTVLTFNGIIFIVIGLALIAIAVAVWLWHRRERVKAEA